MTGLALVGTHGKSGHSMAAAVCIHVTNEGDDVRGKMNNYRNFSDQKSMRNNKPRLVLQKA